MAIEGTPVVVVFLRIPVARLANEVPLILVTVELRDPVLPEAVTSPVIEIVWSPVFAPEELPLIELVPVTANEGVALPDMIIEFTDVGVIAPSVRLMAGVVVGFATVPLTPFAEVTETVVTVPPLPVADSVPPENATPDPTVTLLNPPAPLPYRIELPEVATA